MRIFAAVPRVGGRHTTVGLSTTAILIVLVATSSETVEIRPALLSMCNPLRACRP